jgi:hypothetical protein
VKGWFFLQRIPDFLTKVHGLGFPQSRSNFLCFLFYFFNLLAANIVPKPAMPDPIRVKF